MSFPESSPSAGSEAARPSRRTSSPIPLRTAPEERSALPSGRSGWLIGILLGIVIGLWALPPVRYTLGAQLEFALTENGVPWVRAFDSRRSLREAPRLDAAAARASDDYLVQVGRATALVEAGGVQDERPRTATDDPNDRTLLRLYLLAQQFPDRPGPYAHLARYMTAGRVRILRAELEPPAAPSQPAGLPPVAPRSLPARRRDVRLMEWALHLGESRDPANAFWPAMRAVTYFAAERDADGLRALDQIRYKSAWDAYIYEEVLGQWRLYSAAYGDNGAAQKIGPLSLIAFPHLRELRRMAEMARLLADQAEARGENEKAIRIRSNIARLGTIMRDTAQWAYEALAGTDLLFIATTDSDTRLRQDTIHNVRDWDRESTAYKSLLKRAGHVGDLGRLRQEIAADCDLRNRVDILRRDASYPGVPPGIPLVALFGDWMAGVCLLQETTAILAAALLTLLWSRYIARRTPGRSARPYVAFLTTVIAVVSGMLLFSGLPSVRTAVVFLTALTALFLLSLDTLCARRGTVAAFSESTAETEARRQPAGTWRLLCIVLLPGLAALYVLRPALSGLHPVVALLTSLVGVPRNMTAGEALEIALTAIYLPLAVVLLSALWAVRDRHSPIAGARMGLRRAALPAAACLVVVYLLLLNRTLRLDAAAGSAIDTAAKNDLQWVLTHGSGGAD